MSDFNSYTADSYEQMYTSFDLMNASTGLTDIGHQFWLQGDPYAALQFQQNADMAEAYSFEVYQSSWETYYGPVNAEGYTAYDASQGYTTSDTSFIEPATSAGSTSMISDYSGASNL